MLPFRAHRPSFLFRLLDRVVVDMSALTLLSALSLSVTSALAAVGPTADLTITNGDISPDGYTRAAVLVNGQFPGPLITGNTVRFARFQFSAVHC